MNSEDKIKVRALYSRLASSTVDGDSLIEELKAALYADDSPRIAHWCNKIIEKVSTIRCLSIGVDGQQKKCKRVWLRFLKDHPDIDDVWCVYFGGEYIILDAEDYFDPDCDRHTEHARYVISEEDEVYEIWRAE